MSALGELGPTWRLAARSMVMKMMMMMMMMIGSRCPWSHLRLQPVHEVDDEDGNIAETAAALAQVGEGLVAGGVHHQETRQLRGRRGKGAAVQAREQREGEEGGPRGGRGR